MSDPSELYKLLVARDLIERLRGGAARHFRWEVVRDQIDTLTDGYPFRGYSLSQTIRMFRGRKLASIENPYSVEQMGAPPHDLIRDFGRCQRPGISIMYLSSNVETVMGEIRAEIGDVVQVAEYELSHKDGFLYSIIGEYDFARRHGFGIFGNHKAGEDIAEFTRKMTEIQRLRLHITDAFMAEEFRKYANTNHDYKITAAVSEEQYVLGFGGFFYPSVQHLGGVNFAVRAEHQEIASCISMKIFEVTDVLGYGIFELKNLAEAQLPLTHPVNWDMHDRKLALYGSFLEFLKLVLSISPRNLLLCQYLKRSEVDGNIAFMVVGEKHCLVDKALTLETFIEAAKSENIDFDLLAFSFDIVDGDDFKSAIQKARKNFTDDYLKTASFDRSGDHILLPLSSLPCNQCSEDGEG